MNQRLNRPERYHAVTILGLAFTLAGCSGVGRGVTDLGLAGAGGVVGYHVSDHKVGGAAAGAALGYLASSAAQAKIQQEISAAEKRGYDCALNQAVKQQYWLIQRQQESRAAPATRDVRLESVVIPETKINGVVRNAHIEYLRIAP